VSRLHLFRETLAIAEPSNPAPDRIVSGHPTGEAVNVFESANGKIFSGIWRATTGAWRVSYDETEYCYITKGVARLTSDEGVTKDVSTGDGFIIESGFCGIWDVIEDMEKHYVIVLP
jgi:uncharacterized protein